MDDELWRSHVDLTMSRLANLTRELAEGLARLNLNVASVQDEQAQRELKERLAGVISDVNEVRATLQSE